MQYRVYLTDGLKILCENTAKIGGGSVMRLRWADSAFGNTKQTGRETKTAEEIIAEISEKAGIVIN